MKTGLSPAFSRRDFLKVAALHLCSIGLLPTGLLSSGLLTPPDHQPDPDSKGVPFLQIEALPNSIAEILDLTPNMVIDDTGIMKIVYPVEEVLGAVPLVPTDWNLENNKHHHRLNRMFEWGIVLHWFGDKPGRYKTIKNYMNGFNSIRETDGELYSTSAHFLVGNDAPSANPPANSIGIYQTQMPDKDGTPFIAAHLRGLSWENYTLHKQYFVNAYNNLSLRYPGSQSLLQEMYAGRFVEPNSRTIGIEIAGWDFTNAFPGKQKIANTLAVIKAIMLRYNIPAKNLLGHHEIQMNKSDPGKQFMAMIRYLLGVKALVDGERKFHRLVFGAWPKSEPQSDPAMQQYFNKLREYHIMTSRPSIVYDWDCLSQFWRVMSLLPGSQSTEMNIRHLLTPVATAIYPLGFTFMEPGNHEGVDLYGLSKKQARNYITHASIRLIAEGECLYNGLSRNEHNLHNSLFRHILPNGGEVLSVYSHQQQAADVVPGRIYPIDTRLGEINGEDFLHFAVAYGATWNPRTGLPLEVPLGAGPTFIKERYLEPIQFLEEHASQPPNSQTIPGVFE